MKRRKFIQTTAVGTVVSLIPFSSKSKNKDRKLSRLRVAQVGLGAQGMADIKDMASHPDVDVVAICDVDERKLTAAKNIYTNAKTYVDFREMLKLQSEEIDAVIVSTTDHTHAPISLMAMNLDKHVYCQKPLTRYVSESREMDALAEERNLVTQMGIQVHSFYDYKLATKLIRGGIIGKVKKVIAWSPKVWGYDGPEPEGKDSVPNYLHWDLWLDSAKKRPYKEGFYHPGNWRKCVDFGCATFGDMGVHIFDTPYNALELTIPLTVQNNCRQPNGFGHPEKNEVTYVFPGTKYTTDTLEWVWNDGKDAPVPHEDLILPNDDKLPSQGAMFIGEDGRRLLLPHFMMLPSLIVDGEYQQFEIEKYDPNNELGAPVRDYAGESPKHYHEFVDACLGKGECSAPFSYSAKLTEVILLGVVAAQFPGETLNWNGVTGKFKEEKVNIFLKA